jgi:hypothetical protein
MKRYEYGRIEKLGASLDGAGVPQEAIDQIMAGGEGIRRGTRPEEKAEWLRGAMVRMDESLDEPTRRAVREACACCLGGKRLEISKEIARAHDSLEERIRAANEAKFVFGDAVSLEDGRVLVRFAPEGQDTYGCPCLPKAREPLPITYCFCCGGHVKHHLQIALGRKLACEVVSSALSSGWTRPCTFLFTLEE